MQCTRAKERAQRKQSDTFQLLYIFIVKRGREEQRKLKFFKIIQNSLKAQFASERPKSRSRFFERVGNRWGVQKFLNRKPKTKSRHKDPKGRKESQKAKYINKFCKSK